MKTETREADQFCMAIVRRNSIDGNLYPCEFPFADAVHGSVEACAELRGRDCDKPAEHHEFVVPEPVPVPS